MNTPITFDEDPWKGDRVVASNDDPKVWESVRPSKHTTRPKSLGLGNSHASSFNFVFENPQPVGNWNKHKQRRIPSRIRTVGRLARALRRLPAGKDLGISLTQFADFHGKGWLLKVDTAEQKAGLRDERGRLTQLAMSRAHAMQLSEPVVPTAVRKPFSVGVNIGQGYSEDFATKEEALSYAVRKLHEYEGDDDFEGIDCFNADTGEIWGFERVESGPRWNLLKGAQS